VLSAKRSKFRQKDEIEREMKKLFAPEAPYYGAKMCDSGTQGDRNMMIRKRILLKRR